MIHRPTPTKPACCPDTLRERSRIHTWGNGRLGLLRCAALSGGRGRSSACPSPGTSAAGVFESQSAGHFSRASSTAAGSTFWIGGSCCAVASSSLIRFRRMLPKPSSSGGGGLLMETHRRDAQAHVLPLSHALPTLVVVDCESRGCMSGVVGQFTIFLRCQQALLRYCCHSVDILACNARGLWLG